MSTRVLPGRRSIESEEHDDAVQQPAQLANAPEGWTPPEGWRPNPEWGPAPDGWQYWVTSDAEGASGPEFVAPGSPRPAPEPSFDEPIPPPPSASRKGSKAQWVVVGVLTVIVVGLVAVVLNLPGPDGATAAGEAPDASQSAEATPAGEGVETDEEREAREAEKAAERAADDERRAQEAQERAEARAEVQDEIDKLREEQEAAERERLEALEDPASYATISSRDWQLLERSPDSHVGEQYVIYGRVTQSDSNTYPAFRADTDGSRQDSWYDYDINTMVMPGDGIDLEPVVSDDIVKLYVEVGGAYTYDTSIGGSATSVMVFAYDMEILELAD